MFTNLVNPSKPPVSLKPYLTVAVWENLQFTDNDFSAPYKAAELYVTYCNDSYFFVTYTLMRKRYTSYLGKKAALKAGIRFEDLTNTTSIFVSKDGFVVYVDYSKERIKK